jgi:hypothetical protein
VQAISVYNHRSNEWEVLDERQMGTGDDVVIDAVVADNLKDYISAEGSISVRFYAHRYGLPFTQWANAVGWSVINKH